MFSTSSYLLGSLLVTFFCGISGVNYEEVFEVCKDKFPQIREKYLDGTSHKTQYLVFKYKRLDENDENCGGNVFLTVNGPNLFTPAEVETIIKDYSIADREIIDVFGKIDYIENEKLNKKLKDCQNPGEDEPIDPECSYLSKCYEFEFFPVSAVNSSRTRRNGQSGTDVVLKNLLKNEIHCNAKTREKTFTKIANKLIEKLSEEVHSGLGDEILLPGHSNAEGNALSGIFHFAHTDLKKHLEHKTQSDVHISVSPENNFKEVNFTFIYIIPKAKVEYFNFTTVFTNSNSSGEEICVDLNSGLGVAMTLSMVFENESCKTSVANQEVITKETYPERICDPSHRHIRNIPFISPEETLKYFFVYNAFVFENVVVPHVLERIKMKTTEKIDRLMNCQDFKNADAR